MNDFVFIIQARTGSTRLPKKMVKPFYKDLTIPAIIVSRLKEYFPEIQIVLATSLSKGDDELAENLQEQVDYVVRGSEENVLSRFLEVEKIVPAKAVVRICADNPFIDMFILKSLMEGWKSDYDYLANSVNGIPSMKTCFGFFSEITTFSALKLVLKSTDNPFYFEHVTNYIYGHPEMFKVKFIEADVLIANNSDVRLTVDTTGDFSNASKIYNLMIESNREINYKNVLKTAVESGLLDSMKKENELNAK